MAELDIQSFLTPISAAEPCGPDLSNDPECAAFLLEMRDPGAGAGDYADVVDDDSAVWMSVAERAENWLKKSKNIWVGVYLTLALLKLDELQGFAGGLELLRGFLEKFAAELQPRGEPEDPYPIQQINALSALAGERFRKAIYAARYGPHTLRDFLIADGQLNAAPEAATPVDLPAMQAAWAAFKESSPEVAAAQISTLKAVAEHLGFLRAYVQNQSGPEHRDDLADLSTKLQRAFEVAVGAGTASVRANLEPRNDPAAAATPVARDGEIRSHDDVIQALQRICQFYDKHERISPVPLLLQRAMRLVPMNFLDVVGDLLPDRVAEIEKLAGLNEDKSKT